MGNFPELKAAASVERHKTERRLKMAQSRLTKEEKKVLLDVLGCKYLSLLYKGSIHDYNPLTFHNICNNQGPTVVVGYNASGYIFGGFTSQSYRSSETLLYDEKAFLFRLKGKEKELSPLKIPVKVANEAVFDSSEYGPTFGNAVLVFLAQNIAQVATNVNTATYTFHGKELHGNDKALLECEVYRVEDVGRILAVPWRETKWAAADREEIMKQIRAYKPLLDTVPQIRVLFLGPVGAGKSSFFNSVNSTFRGYVSSQAASGSDSTSLTKQYRTYRIKNGRCGDPLPIIFCDTMGLEEKQGAGLDIDEVHNLLQGHVPDQYQFTPYAAMNPKVQGCIRNPTLKDQIHCVAFIIDGSKVEILPEKLEEKLKEIRRKANNLGVPQIVILTKVDEICPAVEEDMSCVYKSKAVQKQMRLIEAKLGIPLSQVVPVKNYSSELELKDDVDILILMAVRQMLRLAESYFDNFDSVPSDKNSRKDYYSEY
ncbi:interferon-induced protein 44-like [Rhineura floridana]|uniref:interferon-induced protein 44-like n=1 Tax=Rhineura floridana TaxID=261503 RepID=UPI002AC7EDED|nr:interferon-induced protein 44-like [Rhineura floridana]